MGLGAIFFQYFWEVIGNDVYHLVLQFFMQDWLLPNLNSKLVVLLPMFPGADTIENFKPIALASF